jgi:hypothetical protein
MIHPPAKGRTLDTEQGLIDIKALAYFTGRKTGGCEIKPEPLERFAQGRNNWPSNGTCKPSPGLIFLENLVPNLYFRLNKEMNISEL